MQKNTSVKEEISKLKKNRQFLAVAIFLFIGVFFWIAVTLFNSQTQDKISPELLTLAKPLNPNLQIEVLNSIEAKRQYSAAELSSFVIYKILTDRSGKGQRIVPIEVMQADLEEQAATSALEEENTLLGEPPEENSLLFEERAPLIETDSGAELDQEPAVATDSAIPVNQTL